MSDENAMKVANGIEVHLDHIKYLRNQIDEERKELRKIGIVNRSGGKFCLVCFHAWGLTGNELHHDECPIIADGLPFGS